jgi:hypothetical protein
MNKKIFVILFSFFSVFLFIGTINHSTVSAVKYCSPSTIANNKNGNSSSDFSEEAKTCACDPRASGSDCYNMKSRISSFYSNDNGNIAIKYYKYPLKEGSGGSNTTVYGEKMQGLISLIKNIINTAIGIIIFILGFGFVYNMINLGAASNNPQRRQEVIGKIGDIFATAMFIGMIPLITSICLSIVGSLNR